MTIVFPERCNESQWVHNSCILKMEEEEGDYEDGIEVIIKERRKNNEVQYLVKWVDEEEPVWENEEDILEDYTFAIKKFKEKEKSQKKPKEAKKETNVRSSSSPSYPQQKAPRFYRHLGKLVYAKAKPDPIPSIPPPAPPTLPPTPPLGERVLQLLSDLQGNYLTQISYTIIFRRVYCARLQE